jgi:hypothetical protein
MKKFAVIFGTRVDTIALAEAPIEQFGGIWIDVTDMTPTPDINWTYMDGAFIAPEVPEPPPPSFPST